MEKKVVNDKTARRILRQLQRDRQNPDGKEIRKHQRKSWCVVLSAEFEIEEGSITLEHKEEVITHDISQGGFSFIFHMNLTKGPHIKACFDMLPKKPVINGEVRSSRHLYGTQYRIGVSFVHVARANEQEKI